VKGGLLYAGVDGAKTSWGNPPPIKASRIARSFRLTATDTTWSAGNGPEVRGPMAALLLVITGRRVALSELTGPGVAELGRRLPA